MKPTARNLVGILIAAIVPVITSGRELIFLGPENSGAASGGANWMTGANGAAATSVDFDDAAKSGFDFVLSNSVVGEDNKADWRCPPFSLGPAAGARPMIFSFAYKIADPVASKNNIHVGLRFFDASGTNFVGQHVFLVGAQRHDASMADYKTVTIENIVAPPKAKTADIWINANIFEPWVSGTGRFGDFSLTTVPRSLLFKLEVATAALAGIGLFTALSIYLWRRRTVLANEK